MKIKYQSSLHNVTFLSDKFTLKGTLHLPDVDHPPFVVGSHGLLSDRNSPKQIALAESLNSCGIAFFRFDHRGCGDSEGDFKSITSLESRRRDLLDAVNAIASKNETGRFLGLFGSSMGGAACLAAVEKLQIPAMVTVATPVRSRGITSPVENQTDMSLQKDKIDEQLLQFDLSYLLSSIHTILIFHGDADPIVPFSNAMEIHENAMAPKHLIRQRHGDHRMSDPNHQEIFIKESTKWFKNSLNQL